MPTSVFVVDDDPEFRALALRMLAGMGLVIVGEADTIEAATRAAMTVKPQSALVDVDLPDGDGVTLASYLAGLPWRPRIVLTSTDPEVITEADARSAGAVGFIAKHELPGPRLPALLTGLSNDGYG